MLRQQCDPTDTTTRIPWLRHEWYRLVYVAAVCLAILATGLALLTIAVGSMSAQTEQPTQQEARQATLYALPLVIMDVTRQLSLMKPGASSNQFSHQADLSSPSSRMVVRPNVDTLYSSAWLDLTGGPVLLHLPASNGRFFMIQCMDAWTNVFADPGIRTLGNRETSFAVVGPNWTGTVPKGATLLRAPTQIVWVLARVYVRDDSDLDAARAYQQSLSIHATERLSEPPSKVASRPAARINSPQAKRPSMMEVLQRVGPERFFDRFLKLTAYEPPVPSDPQFANTVLRPLGLLNRGATWESLQPSVRDALEIAYADVLHSFAERSSVEGKDRQIGNGWTTLTGSSHGSYGNNYEFRASVAAYGLGAKVKEDGTTFNAAFDSHGDLLDGSKTYRITFAKGATPPTRAFWSITLYDEQGYLAPNAFGRYAVSSGRNPIYGMDGTLTLWIQPDDPGPEKRSNWIPTPRGKPFDLALRCYWPGNSILEDKWIPPAVVPMSDN